MGVTKGPGRGWPSALNPSITNRPTCGGDKKAGLAPTIGTPINILATSIYSANPPNCCRVNQCCYYVPGSAPPIRSTFINPITGKMELCENKVYAGIKNRPVQSKRARYAMTP